MNSKSSSPVLQPDLKVDGDRLWQSLMEMARIGATPAGGCNRQALSDEDKAGRDLFSEWCREIGCELRVDRMGNIFAIRRGENSELPPLMVGSHLDTQPTGGRFDGVYGVLAGLEVLRTLHAGARSTKHDIELVVWTNEEGARFSPAMIGSGVWAGVFKIDEAHAIKDKQGRSLGEELARIGYAGEEEAQARRLSAALEVHIEQGPILEDEGRQIGVVGGVQGMRWYDITVEGEPCHAGPTPMGMRKDPFMVVPAIMTGVYDLAEKYKDAARVTIGDIKADPGVRNTVPQQVTFTLDMRHPDQEILDSMDAELRRLVEQQCSPKQLIGSVREEWNSPAVVFDSRCVDAVRQSVNGLGIKSLEMVSGAGHDSVYVSRVAPTAMIFVPCEGGLSHCETENAKPADLAAGCDVLLHTLLLLDEG
jgi:N-carbamoyl-L-amino-acid hydrolase